MTARRGERLPFSRALLIGFDEPAAGDAISLYFDAAPGRPEVELVAEVFHAGRFDEARILADRSYGFSEPGALALELPTAPERVSLFGTVAHSAPAAAEVGRRGMVSASTRNLHERGCGGLGRDAQQGKSGILVGRARSGFPSGAGPRRGGRP